MCIRDSPTNSQILPTQRAGNPRAALYASKHLAINEINELTHRDMVVGLTRLDGKQTAIISLYLDITTTATPDYFNKALEYCKRRRYAVLADTNAHHKLWGKETNKRGEELEQTLSDYNLIVQNKGLTPTYECKIGQSIIDVTLTVNFRLKIDNWKVCRNYNGSDHNTILYKIVTCLLYTSPSPRDLSTSRMPSSA